MIQLYADGTTFILARFEQHTPVFPALGRLKQDDHNFEPSLTDLLRPGPKKKKKREREGPGMQLSVKIQGSIKKKIYSSKD